MCVCLSRYDGNKMIVTFPSFSVSPKYLSFSQNVPVIEWMHLNRILKKKLLLCPDFLKIIFKYSFYILFVTIFNDGLALLLFVFVSFCNRSLLATTSSHFSFAGKHQLLLKVNDFSTLLPALPVCSPHEQLSQTTESRPSQKPLYR